jgi:hypothetical protein
MIKKGMIKWSNSSGKIRDHGASARSREVLLYERASVKP